MAIRGWQGTYPELGANVYVDEMALVLGRVRLGEDSSVWPGAVLRGDVETISIGARSNVQDLSVMHVTHDGPYSPGGLPCRVGDDVTVGHRAILHACSIGDRCLIGMGAIVMDGVEIGDDCLIAAGALLPPGKHCPPGTLWRGAPARMARELHGEEFDQLRYSAAHYVELKNRHLAATR